MQLPETIGIKKTYESRARAIVAFKAVEQSHCSCKIGDIERVIDDLARSIYRFSHVWCFTNRKRTPYYQSFLNFMLGEDTALNRNEINAIYRYFKDERFAPLSDSDNKKVKAAVKHRQEHWKEITDKVSEQYKHLNSCSWSKAASKIKDFVDYSVYVLNEDSHLLYVNLYNLGYMEGKRAERKRRHQHGE